METTIDVLKKPKLKNPILIEGLPGIGNVGRIVAGYMITELKAKKFAELYSPHFLPLVILHNNSIAQMLKCEFYYHKGKKNDLIILIGDTQSISSEGHYDVSSRIIDFAEELGVKNIITLGGFAEGKLINKPRVVGAVNTEKLIKKYSNYGIDFNKTHSIGTIVGASGLMLEFARKKGMDGLCLMGETVGFPLITDPKAADKVLEVLTRILGIKIDLTKLEKAASEMESKLNKTEEIHRKMIKQVTEGKDREHLRYIG